ncbi:MAG TPA: hypothetical protein DDY31_16590 [Lachnospiraceae bacterium]|nr:hypothetical protein [Lachnospiraceae bacterium]
MGSKQISKNPENRECSSIKQVLLDMKSAGFSSDAIKILLDECEDYPKMLAEADKKFSSHKYPHHSIVFLKITNKIEFFNILSPKAVIVLNAMCCTMNTGNLIQITQDDLLNITNLGNKKTIKEALMELLEKGFIAIRLKGNTRRGTVYMVNPLVARCGKEIPELEKVFWTLTGTKYDGKITEYSNPHDTWKENVKKRTYSIGYGKQDTTSGEIRFGKINEPKIKTKKGSPEATDEPKEELPI